MTSIRDKQSVKERIQDAHTASSAGPRDFKSGQAQQFFDAQSISKQAAGVSTASGAERALERSALAAEVTRVNQFLRTHKNNRTGQHDAPFTLESWVELTPKQRRANLAVVDSFQK